ncbi:hypothetical protein ACUWCL_28410, partial [Klebsiella pneumoniae]|uniref:hypothetical protein n=1 Tax=Klebsiella pneumoniae TaxID=573 RepID=UPI0040557089
RQGFFYLSGTPIAGPTATVPAKDRLELLRRYKHVVPLCFQPRWYVVVTCTSRDVSCVMFSQFLRLLFRSKKCFAFVKADSRDLALCGFQQLPKLSVITMRTAKSLVPLCSLPDSHQASDLCRERIQV